MDVVREAAGLAAYRTGRFAEALRELRTVRRLNGSSEHLAVMADCERGLGRPERALTLADSPEVAELSADVQIELAMVVSGARLDLGEPEAAVAVLASPAVRAATGPVAARVAQARAAALEAAGRPDAAAAELAAFSPDQLAQAAGDIADDDDDIVAFDLEDEADEQPSDVEDNERGVESDGSLADSADDAPQDSDDELGDVPATPAVAGSGALQDEAATESSWEDEA
ncbi:MAG: hypothetical protein ACOH17_15885 [Cellulomonas sp.]